MMHMCDADVLDAFHLTRILVLEPLLLVFLVHRADTGSAR
jgi:hypothetical protein